MDLLEGDVELTEFEAIDVQSVKGVRQGANGFPFLMMKGIGDGEAAKDWAAWDAAHEGGGGGRAAAGGDTKASAADAVARARQTIADHKAGKKVSAAELRNAHEVHEAHLAHEARLKAEAEAKARGKPAAKPPAKKAADDGAGPGFDHAAALELVKAVVGRGKVDEDPDIAGGTAVLAQIADLIIAEAQELKAGQAGEICDILELAQAALCIWQWRTGEESAASGSVAPATMLMQSAMPGCGCCENCTAGTAAKGGPSKAERDQAAAEGNALSDGSYPIRNEHELHAAAILARSGHGDVEGAKRLIARRAKELGVANPLDDDDSDDTSKSQIAEGGTGVDTVTQGNDGLEKAVEAAVAKALAASEGRINALEGELAKVRALPVPGGPMMTRVQAPKAEDGEDHAAKAAKYDLLAEQLADPTTADEYRKLAAQHRAKIAV